MPRIRWAPRPAAPAPLGSDFFAVRDDFRQRGVDLFYDHVQRQYQATNAGSVVRTFTSVAQAAAWLPSLPRPSRNMRVQTRNMVAR